LSTHISKKYGSNVLADVTGSTAKYGEEDDE